jgi:glycosyltransferase involved in cell wall biosynthesis
MEKSLLFIQPIVSHYRKSVIEEITKLEPKSEFWGTDYFQGVEPLIGINNVNNEFRVKMIGLFGIKFVWYKDLVARSLKHNSTHVILSGINPLLIQTFIIFIISRFFTSKKVYWWSQGKRFKQGFIGKKLRYFFYSLADGVFLYSEQGKENFMAEGLPENKLHVINNCLNMEDYGWMNYDLNIDKKNEFRILYTGRLSARKKIIILLKAFKLLK